MEKIDTLVLSGGSVKGIAHIGVLKALKEKNILNNLKIIAGTSVGGIIGCLHNIGYTPEELEELMEILELKLLKNVKFEKIISMYGIDDGKKMECVFEELFKCKNLNENITFLELYEKTKIKLILTTTCINDKDICYLSYETHPNMKVITGLRMTISIPLWYTPVSYENKLYIDGGIMNNYPINLFKKRKNNVIGVYLCEENNNLAKIDNIEKFFFGTLNCVFAGIANNLIHKYEKQTIKLILPNVNIFDLNMDNTIKKNIYNLGYSQTIEFLNEKKEKKEKKKKEK